MDKSPKNPQKINKKSFEPESIQINFNELFRNANDIIFLLDTKGNLIDVNDCAINTYGYTLDEFKKFKIFDLRLPEEIELAKKQFKRVISKGTIKFESIHLKKSGEAFPVEVSTSVIKLKHKKLIQSIIRDISDRKRAEEALINSERRYQLLAENSPVGIFHTDLNGVTTYVNPRWSEISGMNGEDALGDGWLNSVHPDDKKSIISGWNNKVKSKNISNAEYRFLKKDGSVVWVIGQANPEKDDKGNVISYVGTITDITERKIAEIALQDSSENISALLNAPKDSVLIIDTNGIIIDSNEVTCKRLNRKKDKLIGNSLYEFFPNYVSQLRMQKINEAAKTGNAQYFEDVRDEYYFDNTIYPVKDSNGNVVRLVVIARDITERKLAEEELKSKEKQQSLILDSLPIIFYTSYPNKELATKWISEQIKKMTGHSQELFLKDSMFWSKHLHPDDRDKVLHIYEEVFNKESCHYEYRWQCTDGSYLWFSDYLVMTYDEDGKPKEAIGFWIDITEQKKANEELRESEERYNSFINTNNDLMFVKDENLKYILANEATLKFFRKNSEELLNKTDYDLMDKQSADFCKKSDLQTLEKKSVIISEENIKERIYETTKFRMQLKDNKIGIGAIIRDITDRKKAEERLKEQHSLLITIIDNSPDLIYIKDTQSRFLAASKSVANYMGTTPEELINKTDFDFYKKELAEQYYNDERKIIETGQAIINKEEPRKNPDSSVTWILTTKVPLNNVEGKITGIVGISRDITERKHAEEKLILSTENWNKTFNAIQDGIALLDANQQIIQCNQSFLDFIQKTKNEIIGNNCFYYVHGTKCPIEGCPFKRMQISKKREKMEMHINGFVCEILVDPILDKNNNILGAVHIISDISNRKRIEKALQEAKEKAEEANRTKSNFLASMSHELRTPMTGILGFAEILCDSLKDEEDKHKAEIVLKGGQRLMHTLNLILDLSRIEADRIDVKMRLTNLSSVVIESAKLFEILAKDKKLELKTEIDENIFAILDEQLTEQVFSNLIKNALIYTDKGSVCVEVKREMINEKEYAVVKIIDTGIGIPENLREVIFEPFRQVSEGHSREFEGTGLGLTLAKKYIEMMNGSISVSSEVGVGSTFKVKFPTAVDTGKEKIKTNKIEKKHENIIELSGNKLLVVEDDENSKIAIEYSLNSLCELEFTESGEEAIGMVRKRKYDIIIMDIGLKGIDGIITTQEIRKIPGYEKIPIIAVTAFAMDGDKEKFIACGCSHYIAKPFSFAELRKLIKGLVENKK